MEKERSKRGRVDHYKTDIFENTRMEGSNSSSHFPIDRKHFRDESIPANVVTKNKCIVKPCFGQWKTPNKDIF